MPSSRTVPPIGQDIDRDDLQKSKGRHVGRNLSVKCADAVLDWFVFPALLFIQFGATMYCQQQQGVLTLRWSVVLGCVTLFCLVAVAHRKIFRIHPIQSLILLLLPELFTNAILTAVMFTNLATAFQTMVVLTNLMFIIAAVGYIQISQQTRTAEAGDYERLHEDEDIDSDEEWVC
jgi:hypothetical protein